MDKNGQCIRKLTVNDLEEAMALVEKVFMELEAPNYEQEGIDNFLSFINIENLTKDMYAPKIQLELWGCYIDGAIVGVLAARKPFHISLLFVNQEYHKRGIAKLLMHTYEKEVLGTVMDNGREGMDGKKQIRLTVNSSLFAVPIYEKMGFYKFKEKMTVNGIPFVPMVRELNTERN